MVMLWGDLEQISDACYLFFSVATCSLKNTNYLLSQKKFLSLLDFMENEVFVSQSLVQDKIISAYAKKMGRIYLIYIVCGFCNCVEWALVPVFEKEGHKIFPFKIWMPMDAASAEIPEYLLGYVLQLFGIIFSVSTYLTMDIVAISLLMFVPVQLDIITCKIKEVQHVSILFDPKQRRDLIEHNSALLKDCIRRHQALLRYIEGVADIFDIHIFFQLSATVIVVCIIALQMTIEPPNTFHYYSTVNYLMAMLVQLCFYSWSGNEITERNNVLRDGLYECLWYEQDLSFKRTLWIAMEFMSRPLIFKAGNYIPLSRPTFVSILRCSYSYFAVLNQVKNK
ncbi:unnamed protein product [Chilo suppressalis]|uniref:Odorant receptor n=1 Tax=Chilo suppressalis TaxID=168631 RepID=A0ABN8AW05_CHISP|nr:hypothetical protein evm_009639 [Chilo suppressalis]CAH0400353.1 unnamed protein product [Chilo suppressalis]